MGTINGIDLYPVWLRYRKADFKYLSMLYTPGNIDKQIFKTAIDVFVKLQYETKLIKHNYKKYNIYHTWLRKSVYEYFGDWYMYTKVAELVPSQGAFPVTACFFNFVGQSNMTVSARIPVDLTIEDVYEEK